MFAVIIIMLLMVLNIITKKWEEPQCSTIQDWLRELCCIHSRAKSFRFNTVYTVPSTGTNSYKCSMQSGFHCEIRKIRIGSSFNIMETGMSLMANGVRQNLMSGMWCALHLMQSVVGRTRASHRCPWPNSQNQSMAPYMAKKLCRCNLIKHLGTGRVS